MYQSTCRPFADPSRFQELRAPLRGLASHLTAGGGLRSHLPQRQRTFRVWTQELRAKYGVGKARRTMWAQAHEHAIPGQRSFAPRRRLRRRRQGCWLRSLAGARPRAEKLAMFTDIMLQSGNAVTIFEWQGSDSVLFGRDAMQAGRSQPTPLQEAGSREHLSFIQSEADHMQLCMP